MARKTTSLKTEQKTQNSSAQHSTRLGKRLPPVRCLRLAARSREPDFEKVRSRAGGQERQESQEFAFRGSCGLELLEILSAKAVAARTPNFEEAVLRQVGGVMRGGVGRHSQTLTFLPYQVSAALANLGPAGAPSVVPRQRNKSP